MIQHHEGPEMEAVKAVARQLHGTAQWWSVEIPTEWYCTDDADFESFIGGLYHDRVRARIRQKQRSMLTSGIGLVGGILGIAAFIRSC